MPISWAVPESDPLYHWESCLCFLSHCDKLPLQKQPVCERGYSASQFKGIAIKSEKSKGQEFDELLYMAFTLERQRPVRASAQLARVVSSRPNIPAQGVVLPTIEMEFTAPISFSR